MRTLFKPLARKKVLNKDFLQPLKKYHSYLVCHKIHLEQKDVSEMSATRITFSIVIDNDFDCDVKKITEQQMISEIIVFGMVAVE